MNKTQNDRAADVEAEISELRRLFKELGTYTPSQGVVDLVKFGVNWQAEQITALEAEIERLKAAIKLQAAIDGGFTHDPSGMLWKARAEAAEASLADLKNANANMRAFINGDSRDAGDQPKGSDTLPGAGSSTT